MAAAMATDCDMMKVAKSGPVAIKCQPPRRSSKKETAVRNWASFFTVLQKPAGSDLGSFLIIYRNWVSLFLIKKIDLPYQK